MILGIDPHARLALQDAEYELIELARAVMAPEQFSAWLSAKEERAGERAARK